MKLILTQAEKEANTWLELDDESVGKLVKAHALKLIEHEKENNMIANMAAVLILCGSAAEANAQTYKTTIDNLTIKGKPFGSWSITIKHESKEVAANLGEK